MQTIRKIALTAIIAIGALFLLMSPLVPILGIEGVLRGLVIVIGGLIALSLGVVFGVAIVVTAGSLIRRVWDE